LFFFALSDLLAICPRSSHSSNRRSARRTGRGTLFAPRRPHFETLEAKSLLAGDLTAHWVADSLTAANPQGGPIGVWTDSQASIPATSAGQPILVPNQIGGRAVLRFDPSNGIDNFFVDSTVNPLSRANDFSVTVAFRTDSSSLVGTNGPWFNNTALVDANQLGFGRDWGLTINAAGQISSGISGGFASPPATAYSEAIGLNNGELHVATFTRQAGQLSIYINGTVSGQIAGANADPRGNLDMTFGTLTQGTLPYAGDLAEIRLYNGALSAAEVTSLYNDLQTYYSNQAPVAQDDSYTVVEDASLFFIARSNGLLANDSDADGDALSVVLMNPPSHGQVSLNPDGSFLYDPSRNFFGQDSFTYVARDFRDSNVATVTLNVTPVYDPPVGRADSYQGLPGSPLVFSSLVGVLANDDNPDNASLTAVLADNTSDGVVSLASDGSFIYDPAGFTGQTSFTYRVNDGTRLTDPILVRLVINSAPVAVDDSYDLSEDTPLVTTILTGVVANDIDAQAQDILSVTLVDAPVHGELAMNPDGSFTYVPAENYFGTDQFTYRVSDGIDPSNLATVQLTIRSVNDAPTAVPDGYFLLPSGVLSVPAERGVLVNDSDIEADPFTAELLQGPTRGTLSLNADGSFVYQPQAGFEGRDRFEYVARDSSGTSAPTTVEIQVAAKPLVLTEFLTANGATLPSRVRRDPTARFVGDARYFDWIEIQNLLDVPVDLGGFHLTDQQDQTTRWQFPAGSMVAPGGYLTVFASGLDLRDPALDELGILHTNFGLDSQPEYLGLTDSQGNVIDEYGPLYPEQRGNVSYGLQGTERRYFATPTPGEPNGQGLPGFVDDLVVSKSGGFFETPFEVSISSPDASATIRYTLDGSTPSLINGLQYAGPISVSGTTMLRAGAFRDGLLPSRVETETYMNLADVLVQSPDGSAPEGWPSRPVRGQLFDYGMDPNIVNDPKWSPQLLAAFTQIPSLSVVTDLANLVDPTIGIYVNASQDGRPWERPASVELINPDGSAGFQIDAGLRIRGGFSRGGFNPKHAFRLLFRDVYEGDLDFSLFGSEGAESFGAVDLRTAQNYAWSNNSSNDERRNSFLRDVFSRDLQREQGQMYTRSRYYHLYLNGQYWGLFQTEERPEATYAETYLGGLAENYDVIKASGGTLEATDGTLDAWSQLWAIARDGFQDLGDYFFIQGRNPDGTENPELEVHVQVDVLIDFMLNVIFTGNEDMPTTLGAGDLPNNFFAIRDASTRDGWQFIAHDNEHNMLSVNHDQTRDDSAGRSATSFNPKYLHQQLDDFPEYQIAFADRVHEAFFHDGIMTTARAQALMQNRIDQIDTAIIAESARWGDQHNEPPLTKDTWEREVDWLMNTFLAQRGNVVLSQLRRKGLYPSLEAPQFNQHGGVVDTGFALQMSAPAGTIYYTLDGTDPRQIGGTVEPSAMIWSPGSSFGLTSDTRVMSRTWDGSSWSALNTAQFLVGIGAPPTTLRVSEVHYNPGLPSAAEIAAGFDDKDDFEFLELINVGSAAIDLTQARLVQLTVAGETVGVDFDFATSPITRLAAGERVVVAENTAAFRFRYGNDLPLAGQWGGGLGNGGELITLQTGDDLIQQFTYDDAWHPATDGGGFSLELIAPGIPDLQRWNQATAWRQSAQIGGSPGRDSLLAGDSNADGIFNSSDLVLVFQAGKYEDGIANNATFAEGDWNGDGDFTTADLVLAFQLGNYVPGAVSEDPLEGSITAIDAVFSTL
jgi:hypothetical protein